ncbi:TIGR00645 family protein [Lysinibacter sp. HNR]|uniref:TIGR00645 family protein n=1 Tax=Lysinibacter sp. HNR TaxID=3031408 RepID=UPI0024350239|nr:TIGR00645 family protein [Lysinibacter sp. HNR]WGD37900.1 TIGR00645 family protein [Lysinibacter sp. HNR]
MQRHPTTPVTGRHQKPVGATSRALGYIIFTSRWLQAPLYLGLIVAQAVYVVVFMIELWHLIESVFAGGEGITEAAIMLTVLGLIDVVMIANLLIMVIIGGYEIFVSKVRVEGHPDEPDWLSHVNANLLKIKLSISIISISSIHLLKTFIEVGPIGGKGAQAEKADALFTSQGVMWQVIIHLTFIVSALALAWIDRVQNKTLMEAAALGQGPGAHSTESSTTPAPSHAPAAQVSASAPAS